MKCFSASELERYRRVLCGYQEVAGGSGVGGGGLTGPNWPIGPLLFDRPLC